MKPQVIVVAAMMFSSAFAADIALTDGRILTSAIITSQSPRNVIIKHTGGLTSVAKQQLPAALLAKYPIDEAAARAADEKAVSDRQTAIDAQKKEAERAVQFRAQREANVTANSAAVQAEADSSAAQRVSIKRQAQSALEHYFLETFSKNLAAERTVEVTITDIRQTEGWRDRWSVKGRAVIRDYQPSAQPVDTTGMNAREASRAEYRTAKKMSEIREFEADYAPDSSRPLNVTLR